MLESVIQRACVSFAREHDAIAIKLSTLGVRGVAGWPDYLFLYEGKTLFIEFKRPGGKLTALQTKRAKDLRAQGFPVEVVDNFQRGRKLLARAFGWGSEV